MKYSVITFGCRVNQADSLEFEEDLRAAGASSAPPQAADLVIVNTCSVPAAADQGARQAIRRVARDNPSARIIVTGCYATRRPDEVAALPNVVGIVPNDDKPRLLQLAGTDLRVGPGRTDGSASTTANRLGDGPCGAPIEPGIAGRTAFTLRVQTGCAEPCAYCIIPATRCPPRILRPRRRTRDLIDRASASARRRLRTSRGFARRGPLPHQLTRTYGLLARDRRSRRGLSCFRSALPPSTPAREQPLALGHAPALHDRFLFVTG